jgi:hypothetical protein
MLSDEIEGTPPLFTKKDYFQLNKTPLKQTTFGDSQQETPIDLSPFSKKNCQSNFLWSFQEQVFYDFKEILEWMHQEPHAFLLDFKEKWAFSPQETKRFINLLLDNLNQSESVKTLSILLDRYLFLDSLEFIILSDVLEKKEELMDFICSELSLKNENLNPMLYLCQSITYPPLLNLFTEYDFKSLTAQLLKLM